MKVAGMRELRAKSAALFGSREPLRKSKAEWKQVLA
jgi:hypothetical protein